ncbi:MAG: trypsin-like peptidase domain-containing protein [Clostridia bacterium]|nr:trypsin-like peptidase domain-containing protein [Clostridia bacterium]
MADDRHFDPFGRGMAPLPRRKTRRGGRLLAWAAGILAAMLLLTAAAVGAVILYDWMTGRQVSLTGRKVTFQQVQTDRENALSIPEIFEKCRGWVTEITVTDSGSVAMGTGIVFSEDGYIVTCAHVLEGNGGEIAVKTVDGTTFPAQVVASDAQTDIAVLKVAAHGMEPAELGYGGQVLVGETAVALGNPLGRGFSETLTAGVVSARERSVVIERYEMSLLQFDAAVNSGNSGGPLINSAGQVIGMVNAKISRDEGARVEGIGFAVPIDRVVEVAQDLIRYGFVQNRPWLGVVVTQYDGEWPAVRVESVTEDGAADRAGIRAGDWILAFNGVPITSYTVLNREKDRCAVGDAVIVVVRRDGTDLPLECTLFAMTEADRP